MSDTATPAGALEELQALLSKLEDSEQKNKKSWMRRCLRDKPFIEALSNTPKRADVLDLIEQIADHHGFSSPAQKLLKLVRAEWRLSKARQRQDDGHYQPKVYELLYMATNAEGEEKGPIPNIENACLILENDSRWARRLKYNEMKNDLELDGKTIPDAEGIELQRWMFVNYSIDFSKAVAEDAFISVANKHTYHPIREYLKGLEWDGVSRIDDWLCEYCKCPDDIKIIKTYARRWLIAGVARIMVPGEKADNMLILQGAQDIGKSTLFEALCPEAKYFSDTRIDLGNKDADAMLQLQGIWIYEFAEVDTLRGTSNARMKAFITSRTDKFRAPYGRRIQEYPRQCLLAGTANKSDFLRDPTGSRRYWPVRIPHGMIIDIAGLLKVRDQLWAEAVHLYLQHWAARDLANDEGREWRDDPVVLDTQWWLTDAEKVRRERSAFMFTEEDPLEGKIIAWTLDKKER